MHVEPMEKGWKPHVEISPTCPRCGSSNTKFCYYNNYSLTQPRYFCKACRRYWTKGGSLRNVPVGGGCRKTRRSARPHIIPPRPAGAGRISPSLSPSPTIAKRADHGSNIDLALVYANFLNQKPRANMNDQNSSSPDHHNHHHPHIEIPMLPRNLSFGGGNCGLMSFQFPYPLMSQVNGTFLDDQCRPLSAYGHHHHSSDAHFSNAFDYLSGLDSIPHEKQTDYHHFMMNNSSVENVTNNLMSYNLPPLPGDEELNILWSDSSNNNLVFPNSNTRSSLVHATQNDRDQFSSRIEEEQRVLPQHDAAEATVQEKQLGDINGIGSQINLPIELCNFQGLE